jgi:endonuclease/exonuclease/phosphatase (EEP) superfamily protein YafD
MAVLKGTIFALTVLVLAGTALPFLRTDEWWVRVFDFPRLQIACLGLILAVTIACWRRFSLTFRRLLPGLILMALAVQAWHLFPYTMLGEKQVLAASAPGPELKVLVVNVLQENRESERLLQSIAENQPDLIVATEVDEWWTQTLQLLQQVYPHSVLHPQDNTYGKNLLSRLPLHNPSVRFLTDPGVPSIRVGVEVEGRMVHLFAVHPRPPGRVEGGSVGPRDSGQRDAELVLIAREVKHIRDPVIVAGDFNDVAWSHTTRLFQRISGLLDPRIGRGMFNTYHARLPLLRFPLDHLFHSDHFRYVDLRRLGAMGSDHFPVLVTLRLQEFAEHQQEAPPEKPADAGEAAEIVEEERREGE